jgi:SAM-dependent methyltransferase
MLDAGCGDGRFAAALAVDYPSAHVLGIDADPLALAAGAARATGLPNLELRVAAVGGARLDRVFDTIVCGDLLEHVVDDRGAFLWLGEHLEPGGTLIVHVPASPQRHVLRSVANAMKDEVRSGRGPHLREGYSEETVNAWILEADLLVREIAATFHLGISRLAADVDTWTFLRRRRAAKAALLPLLLPAAAAERAPSRARRGNGLLVVAVRS